MRTYPYKTFNNYLRERFNARVYRVPLDAGFDCPNRDGTRASGGCTFCDENGSGAPTIKTALNIKQQLEDGIERIKERFKAQKFLAYFQAFTNTYAPEAVLKTLYDTGLDHEDVIGLVIGTRPDCLAENILDLLAEYNRKTFVWLEVGLQSAFDQTLQLINRAHTAEEFFYAVRRVKKHNISIATHLIFGLPGENKEMMMETVRRVADCGIDAIKIHQLCIYKGTVMEQDYKAGKIRLLDIDEYVELVVDALEILPPDMIIMRLVAEGSRRDMVGPEWAFDKFIAMDKIDAEFARRKTQQGSRYRSGTLKTLR